MLIISKHLDLFKSVMEGKGSPDFMRSILLDFESRGMGVLGVDLSVLTVSPEEFNPTHRVDIATLVDSFKETPSKDEKGTLKTVWRLTEADANVYVVPTKHERDTPYIRELEESSEPLIALPVHEISEERSLLNPMLETLQQTDQQKAGMTATFTKQMMKAAGYLIKFGNPFLTMAPAPNGQLSITNDEYTLYTSGLA